MITVDAESTLNYLRGPGHGFLRQTGLTPADLDAATVTELAWGVSNIVIRVDGPDATNSFVLKQSRKKLRTRIDWFSRLDRIWREVEMLRVLQRLLPDGTVPSVLFEDRKNFLFAMEAIDADHRVWKEELLGGHADARTAAQLADCLAAIHRGSAGNCELMEQLGDRVVFDELRLDPFYRYVAERHRDCRQSLETLVDESLSRSDALVLGDFSPKNILLTSHGPVLVDFETGHFGDPAFDVGFFLSHLLLKVVFHAGGAGGPDRWLPFSEVPRKFAARYLLALSASSAPVWCQSDRHPGSDYQHRCVRHLGACMLARVAGKSRVDYLCEDWQSGFVADYCRHLLNEPSLTLVEAFDGLDAALRRRPAGS